MAYAIEVRVRTRGDQFTWKRLRPTGGRPYAWATRQEADHYLYICYGGPCPDARVVEIEEEPTQ